MCGNWDDDDYSDGPCYTRPKVLGCILLLITAIGTTGLVLSGVDLHKVHDITSNVEHQETFSHALEVKIRPQFYTFGSFVNETHISSSNIMVKDETLYSKSYCQFSDPEAGLTRLDFLLQIDFDFSGPDIHTIIHESIEFRFDTPYGMDLSAYSKKVRNQIQMKCPEPECGRWDYRERIGNGNFLNADAVFVSHAETYLNVNTALPISIICGCSREVADSRFSCTIPSDMLFGKKGTLSLFVSIIYPIA